MSSPTRPGANGDDQQGEHDRQVGNDRRER
jgi:hypothetical protein